MNQTFINSLIIGIIYAIIALGFSLIYRTVRFFHFAHGVVYATGAYAAFSMVITLSLSPVLGFFLPVS